MRVTHELKTIPDDELLRRLAELLRQSHGVEADLVAHIGEVDALRSCWRCWRTAVCT
jgi:hypothetical protein